MEVRIGGVYVCVCVCQTHGWSSSVWSMLRICLTGERMGEQTKKLSQIFFNILDQIYENVF